MEEKLSFRAAGEVIDVYIEIRADRSQITASLPDRLLSKVGSKWVNKMEEICFSRQTFNPG